MILISIGAVIGALIRWQVSNDFAINVFGSGLLGFIYSMQFKKSVKLFLGFGLCGSLTTFSGWIINSIHLGSKGLLFLSLKAIFVPLFLSFIVALIAFFLGKQIRLLVHSQ